MPERDPVAIVVILVKVGLTIMTAPTPDRVAIVVILAKAGLPIMTAPGAATSAMAATSAIAATAATLTFGLRRAGQKREVSIRVERRDDRRRREHEGEHRRRRGGALKGLPCRVSRHLGPPFTRALAHVAPG